MKASSMSNVSKRKPHSATSSISQCLPPKKSSLIYKSIYLNMMERAR